MPKKKTNLERHARQDQLLLKLDPTTTRAQALRALRSFRTSWVELGRILTDVAFGGHYKDWGYDEFEVYCARELGIKKPTVRKLMTSYNYMKEQEPKLLESLAKGEERTLPEYQTVEQLAKARSCETYDQDRLTEVHAQVMSGEMADQDAKQAIQAVRNEAEPALPGMERTRELQDVLRAARALRRRLIHTQHIPVNLKDHFDQVIMALEALD